MNYIEKMLLVLKAWALSFSRVGHSWQGVHRVAASLLSISVGARGQKHTAQWRRRNIVTLFQSRLSYSTLQVAALL